MGGTRSGTAISSTRSLCPRRFHVSPAFPAFLPYAPPNFSKIINY
jgi:hypothetical protein